MTRILSHSSFHRMFSLTAAALLAITLVGCGGDAALPSQDEQPALTQEATPLGTWRTFRHAPPTLDWYNSHLDNFLAYKGWDGSNWCARVDTSGTFEHAPNCDWSQSHLDAYIAYKTWGGSNWCMRITNGIFEHAPNCDWTQHHYDIIMNYQTWNGANWALAFE